MAVGTEVLLTLLLAFKFGPDQTARVRMLVSPLVNYVALGGVLFMLRVSHLQNCGGNSHYLLV